MVEKELQQDQVVGAELSAQEEVTAQSAVDVLDDRTGADDVLGQLTHGCLELVEARAELLTQRRFFLPTSWLAFVQSQKVEQFADAGHGDLEIGGELGQIFIELGGEGQELRAVIFQERAQRVQAMRTEGRTHAEWAALEEDARLIAQAGAFAVVLEAIAEPLAAKITAAIPIPTIGIGASAACDGQILVMEDMLGLSPQVPKFVKQFGQIGAQIENAIRGYADAVRSKNFPTPEHTYAMKKAEPERPPAEAQVSARATKKPKTTST